MYVRPEFLKQDLAAGFVVFLVALPLCLGIALASDAPLLSGIITGIIAGLLVSLISGSELSVSGPAAGLTAIILAHQAAIGSFEGLLIATALSGVLQILLGTIRAGHLATFFPTSVIKGMLAGIGIIIILKQFPYLLGWRGDFDLEDGLLLMYALNDSRAFISQSIDGISFGAALISITSLTVMLLWQRLAEGRFGFFRLVPGALAGVTVAVLLNSIFTYWFPQFALSASAAQLVQLPALSHPGDLFALAPALSLDWLINRQVWSAAITIALVGSVETLLCIEATDKLDPLKRVARPNRELVAQGVGNICAGLLGGIPMTSVIVRSSANVYAGARTRIASFFHGVLLLVSVLLVPELLNQIPLAALASVLILVGYKLCNPRIVRSLIRSGADQYLPFVVTVCGVVFLDLLSGVAIGTAIGLAFVLRTNHHSAFTAVQDETYHLIRFNKDVTFMQKAALKRTLARIPNNTTIHIDGGSTMFIDHDILELLQDFKSSAIDRNVKVELRNFTSSTYRILESSRPGEA